MGKFTQTQLDEINPTLKTSQDDLKWALENLHPRVAKASSFGAEDSVIINMMVKINPTARFFTLDTGRLNPETYTIMAELSKNTTLHLKLCFQMQKKRDILVLVVNHVLKQLNRVRILEQDAVGGNQMNIKNVVFTWILVHR